jgi:thioredoxin
MNGQVVRCPKCGQANRVPTVGSGKKAVCGKCRAPLDASQGSGNGQGHPIVLSDATFAETIRNGSFVVDFWAAWCGPCRMIAPILDELADELAQERSDVTFAKLNVDENPRTAAQFHVQGIPLLIFFRNGAEAGRVVGAVPKGQIEAAIQRYFP